MSMLDWAKEEIKIANDFESKDLVKGEFNYGGDCYDSALKAFEALLDDNHSGNSIHVTKNILNRLIDGKALTPIEDIPEMWMYVHDSKAGASVYQCKRDSSLFKDVHSDGTITYNDNDRIVCIDLDTKSHFHSGFIAKQISPLYPITMPYMPMNKSISIYCREFLVDEKNGDFDTIGIMTVVHPNGTSTTINRFFKESKIGWDEITEPEYNDRYAVRIGGCEPDPVKVDVESLPMLPATKIKVGYAKIFSTNWKPDPDWKPYYQIEYHDLSDNEIHIGFGSYEVKWLYQWIGECFDFTPEEQI